MEPISPLLCTTKTKLSTCTRCEKEFKDQGYADELSLCDDCEATTCHSCGNGDASYERSDGEYECVDCHSAGIDYTYDMILYGE